MRERFITLTSPVVPLERDNVDTDQIIPARFLKATSREGFGDKLFHDWRYDSAGCPRPDFVLNDPTHRGTILAAGKNFGCGSSREHAAWAIRGAGFRAVLSPRFADIFRENALNNGLLPVQLPAPFLERVFTVTRERPEAAVTVDLERQEVRFEGETAPFDIPPYRKRCLLQGFDDIDYLLSIRDKIILFEKQHAL
ncbi:MAG: 3-isopropylmalate dehydratase small subunit [Odoribacteraceae bacterium]|jgi:3-isopropylmalate/(R)-2-methylmalate dehydratase small subunit|nr:3-isopropylmalate dehydratase small subunit [Odoribacteraceae bacterium]